MARCWSSRDLPGADLAVLFMHNEGYSTMCGHAVIALGRYAVDQGLVAAHGASDDRQHRMSVRHGGRLMSRSRTAAPGAVSFESVPAFLYARRPGGDAARRAGRIRFDIAYGGAFYALADCRQFGLAFGGDRASATSSMRRRR